jgi:UDP-3-O-[3-hydroxymyristoyl] glucosamine N-acyltransferase
MSATLAELALRFGCELRGDPELRVDRVAPLGNAGPGSISFLSNRVYRRCLASTAAAAVILGPEDAADAPVAVLVCEQPYAVYARIAALLHPEPAVPPGIHPTAVIDPQACLEEGVSVGAKAVVGAGVRLAERASIGPGSVLEDGVTVGADSRLLANVTLCAGVTLGSRCLIHPGAVIGARGFGIAWDHDRWVKVPQLGTVRIGDDVEVGANTAIDRGAIEDTVIGDDVHLDNLIQIGHNVRIGAHTAIAAGTAVAGSVTIGAHCLIAGHVGLVGHIEVCDGAVIQAKALVTRSIREPGEYGGCLPAEPAARWRRNAARFRRLHHLERELRKGRAGGGPEE